MHLREPFPLRAYIGLSWLGIAAGLAGAVAGAQLAARAENVETTFPIVAPAPSPAEMIPVASALATREARPAAPSNRPGFVIEVDHARWLVLDLDAATVTSHPTPRLVGADGSDTIALLRAGDLTAELRGWRGQDVIVYDSEPIAGGDGTCRDVLRDFAVITRVTGDPSYAGDAEHWTTSMVEANGVHLVAAKLAHCTGTYARAGSAPAAVPYLAVGDGEAIERAARDRLLASRVAREIRAEVGAEVDFVKATTISTKVARDPRTGATWIAVHARADFACGGPEINFFGLYRLPTGAPGGGLVPVREERSPDLAAVDALVDLDGDGVPELLGSGWIAPTRAFYSQDLAPLVSYAIPFFGCPC